MMTVSNTLKRTSSPSSSSEASENSASSIFKLQGAMASSGLEGNTAKCFRDWNPDTPEQAMTLPKILPLILPKAAHKNQESCCMSVPVATRLNHFIDFHDSYAEDIAWAIQNGVDADCIEQYLYQVDTSQRSLMLNKAIKYGTGHKTSSVPVLAFAVERKCSKIIRALCAAGASPDCSLLSHGIPLLAYAVLLAENDWHDTTDIVMALLAMGANPKRIPYDMWQNPLRAPRKDAPSSPSWINIISDGWCIPELRQALARSLTFLQRYALYKAASAVRPTPRMLQVAESGGIMALFEISYHIIGQQGAIQEVLNSILDHYLFKRKTPLAMFLTGLSGHGKTELARQMGNVLSLPMQIVDCTTMRMATDIFGPNAPYQGWERGSPLNNYLASYSGKASVVFLDEFDKTTDDVRKALLLPFESGFYHDRRNQDQIDCSKTIWMLAGNLGMNTISRFWESNMKNTSEERKASVPFEQLQDLLQGEVMKAIGEPLTGRLSRIVPYVPFDDLEMAAATYKFMRETLTEARKDIDEENHEYFWHLVISYIDDGKIAASVAKRAYVPRLGARSLQMAVQKKIERCLSTALLEKGEKITNAKNEGPLEAYEVRLVENGDIAHVKVDRVGTKELHRRTDH